MTNISDLELRVEALEKRNKRVEVDKAWEISSFRRVFLAIFTYISVALYFWVIKIPNPLLNAVVPTLGFLLSTLTLPLFKNLWVKYFFR